MIIKFIEFFKDNPAATIPIIVAMITGIFSLINTFIQKGKKSDPKSHNTIQTSYGDQSPNINGDCNKITFGK